MGEFIVVYVTAGSADEAERITAALVEERLAACVNAHVPMTSTYRWQGTVEVESERQVVIKTTRANLKALEARLRSLHPYELPEFIVLDATASDAYAAWIAETTSSPS
jgi:periplasmic divalent cation tolerance protein